MCKVPPALGTRGNYDPTPLILRDLCPAGMMMMMIFYKVVEATPVASGFTLLIIVHFICCLIDTVLMNTHLEVFKLAEQTRFPGSIFEFVFGIALSKHSKSTDNQSCVTRLIFFRCMKNNRVCGQLFRKSNEEKEYVHCLQYGRLCTTLDKYRISDNFGYEASYHPCFEPTSSATMTTGNLTN